MTLVFRQTLAVLPVFLVRFMIGIGVGWLAPMLHRLRSSPQAVFTSEQCAWIAALHYLSRGLSPFLSIFLLDTVGRNSIFVCSSFIYCLMWIFVYASTSAPIHYAVRFLFGVGVGMVETTISIYIGENCSSELRGVFSGITYAFLYLGVVSEFLLAAHLSYEGIAICNGIIGFLVIVSTLVLLREPAHFLIARGKTTKAERNYHYLHDLRNAKSKLEFDEIKAYVNEQRVRVSPIREYCSGEVIKSTRIVVLTNFFCMGCGFSAINSFVTVALADGSDSTAAISELTILFGVCQFVSVSLSSVLLDKFNRRTLFLLTGVVTTIVHAATAVLYFVNSAIYIVPRFNVLLFILLTTFSCANAMFTFPVTTAIQGELLPQNVKAVGSGLAVVSSSISGFLGAKVFLPIADSLGMHVNFILFSFLSLVMTLHAYFDLPETKGKTLVDIQRELKRVDLEKANANEKESFCGLAGRGSGP